MVKLVSVLALLSACLYTVLADDGSCGCASGTKTGKHVTSKLEACRIARRKCTSLYSTTCAEGFECPRTARSCSNSFTVIRGFPKIEAGRSGDPKWKCKVRCGERSFKCVKPGAIQDPHFTDFTGTRFDFHGVHENRYVILARDGGDSLVAEMIGKQFLNPTTKRVSPRTYFNKFGLRTSAGDKVVVKIGKQRRDGKNRWASIVELNGKVVKTDIDIPGFSLKFSADKRVAHIKTKEMGYSFTAVPRSTQERLDFHASLLRKPKVTDRFMGVLGMSLNKKIGHDIRFGLMKTSELHPEDLELSLRDQFQVKDLHPEAHLLSSMHGIVRMSKKITKGSYKKVSAKAAQ